MGPADLRVVRRERARVCSVGESDAMAANLQDERPVFEDEIGIVILSAAKNLPFPSKREGDMELGAPRMRSKRRSPDEMEMGASGGGWKWALLGMTGK